MAIEKFVDELGSDLNKYQVTLDDGTTYEIKLVRKANITQVGTLLNASKLNELVNAINTNSNKQINFNGANNNTPSFYAPTTGGTSGFVLKSNGNNAPTWVAQSDLTSGKAIKDSDGNQINTTYAKKVSLSKVATSNSYNDLSDKPTLFSGNYNDLSNKPTIPTVPKNVGAFTNDVGYAKTSAIPTKTSQLTNDSGFATTSQLPTKLGDLTNNINNVYLNKTSWTISSTLPSTGLYAIRMMSNNVLGVDFNLGVVYWIKTGGTIRVSTFYAFVNSNLQHYFVTVDADGNLKLYQQTGNTVAKITANFYYIKLS